MSRSATWARRFAAAGAGLAVAAIVLSHHGTLGPKHGLALLSAGLAAAILAVPCSVAAAIAIWRQGLRGVGRMLLGLALAVGTLAYPSLLVVRAFGQPMAFEASTDEDDPPRFSLSPHAFAIRGDSIWDHAPTRHDAKRASGSEPVILDAGAREAFSDVLSVLKLLRWRVIESLPPGGRSGLGHIDAVTYSAVMHLPQDLAIRIRPLAGQTRVDIRSASRLRVLDVGDDARNVEAIAKALRDQEDGT